MIYLDNAATSFPKPEAVYGTMLRCMREYCANPGRSGHRMSVITAKAVNEARAAISRFFNISYPMRLSFTKNATEALNIAIRGSLKAGEHAIATSMEHNSVIRPLKTMERDAGIELTIVECDNNGFIDVSDIEKSFRTNTRLVICTLASNVTGAIFPVKEIGSVCRRHDVNFLVDAAQGAGYASIDVSDMNIDMLAFPGHKGLLGPQGTGGLYVREGIRLNPIMQGGTGSNSEEMYQPDFMPDLLESGTLNTPGIIGLSEGIKFIESFGFENLKHYRLLLLKKLIEGIKDIKGAIIYGSARAENNAGIAAVNLEGADSVEISYMLDKEYEIASRAGLHCAPLAHRTLGTISTGIVRLSIGCFNTFDEIDYTINAMRKISERIR